MIYGHICDALFDNSISKNIRFIFIFYLSRKFAQTAQNRFSSYSFLRVCFRKAFCVYDRTYDMAGSWLSTGLYSLNQKYGLPYSSNSPETENVRFVIGL